MRLKQRSLMERNMLKVVPVLHVLLSGTWLMKASAIWTVKKHYLFN
jgi:hypothetical protein